jgi:hypothetical protein
MSALAVGDSEGAYSCVSKYRAIASLTAVDRVKRT